MAFALLIKLSLPQPTSSLTFTLLMLFCIQLRGKKHQVSLLAGFKMHVNSVSMINSKQTLFYLYNLRNYVILFFSLSSMTFSVSLKL